VSRSKSQQGKAYTIRAATVADVAGTLQPLYEQHARFSPLLVLRDKALWHYLLVGQQPENTQHCHFCVVEDGENAGIAYFAYAKWGSQWSVNELMVRPGHSWRGVGIALARFLLEKAESTQEQPKPVTSIRFQLGDDHPLYLALAPELGKQQQPYAWYLRVAEMPAFLRHIAPALEKRLAGSIMAGHSGALKLNFYTSQLQLQFNRGKLIEIAPYTPKDYFDADLFFPDLTFLQPLFGYRSLSEMRHYYPDCYPETKDGDVLFNALFPRLPTIIHPVS